MNDLALKLEEEKNTLTEKLSDQYSQNVIDLGEYERLLEYVNKIETVKELNFIKNIIQSNSANFPGNAESTDEEIEIPRQIDFGKNLAFFSSRSSAIQPHKGYGGNFDSIFGTHKIIAENLPYGRTVININSLFGSTEIVVPKNIKVTDNVASIFGNVDIPKKTNSQADGLSELHIVGSVIFGNVQVKRKK